MPRSRIAIFYRTETMCSEEGAFYQRPIGQSTPLTKETKERMMKSLRAYGTIGDV
jgi:hypothetical protein